MTLHLLISGVTKLLPFFSMSPTLTILRPPPSPVTHALRHPFAEGSAYLRPASSTMSLRPEQLTVARRGGGGGGGEGGIEGPW